MRRFKSYAVIMLALGLLLPILARASTLTTLYSIPVTGDGGSPASLINVGGVFYGTTSGGGSFSQGAVYKFNRATGAEAVVYSFKGGSDGANPNAALLDVGGTLYGTTVAGGSSGQGTVFKINPTTGAETVVYSFTGGSDGTFPYAALINVGGTLYGTTAAGGSSGQGTVFKINPTTGAETVVYSFNGGSDGANPDAALINVGGTLYGTTEFGGSSFGGTVFKINPTSGVEAVVYSFTSGSDGADPSAALIDVGGTLYGTTYGGGSSFAGTVFKINRTTGAETVVYVFTGGSDGANPDAALINVGGTLYGSTAGGGSSGQGTVFKVNPTTGAETVVHSFTGGSNGSTPAALLNVGGTLYGTTFSGGSSGDGTVFTINPTTSAQAALYSFTGPTFDPAATLYDRPQGLLNLQGSLFLTASQSSAAGGYGDIVKINPTTDAAAVIHSFKGGNDGTLPDAALIDVAGTLYGTTNGGGSSGQGTVFKINPTTGAETVVYSFKGGYEARPYAALLNVGGTLYGTTSGGLFGLGSVFKINPTTGAETVVHSFNGGSDGAFPYAALINVGGTLYGTTYFGGSSYVGTVFKINPTSGVEAVVYSFTSGSDGANPTTALLNVGGTLYGTTAGGGTSGRGTVFKINPTTGAETVVHSFTGGSDGGYPTAPLINIAGTLYGATSPGGPAAVTVFSLIP